MKYSPESNVSSANCENAFALKLLELINTPHSLALYLALKYKDYPSFFELVSHPSTSELDFRSNYLAGEFLRKSPYMKIADTRQAAVDAWFRSEDQCANTNKTFGLKGTIKRDGYIINQHESWVWDMQKHIFDILGLLTKRRLNKAMDTVKFGPGTNGSTKVGGPDNFNPDNVITLTDSLRPYVKTLMQSNWHDNIRGHFNVIEYNSHTTVPKTSLTDRSIAVEPQLNISFQLRVGSLIRESLLRDGINLESQGFNQFLAKMAHKWDLCTIDIESASDTVAYSVVEFLLPTDWFDLLELGRCSYTKINGELIKLNKFSSMGNGYTFELETLLFWALVKTTVPEDELPFCTVYGDDIIIPRKYFTKIHKRLSYLGFKVNLKKTHVDDVFFESCGEHYYKGRVVTPFYLKGASDKIPYALTIANKLRIYAKTCFGCDSKYKRLWHMMVHRIPKTWRVPVPSTMPSNGIIMDKSEISIQRVSTLYNVYKIRYMKPKMKAYKASQIGIFLYMLNNRSIEQALKGVYPIRRRLCYYSIITSNVYWIDENLSWF